MNSLTPTSPPAMIDGFAFDDGEARSGANYVKFDAAAIHKWNDRDGALKNFGPVANLFPENLKWNDKRVVERILPEIGKPLANVDELNAAIPKKDWEEGFNGTPKGPWVRNYTGRSQDRRQAHRLQLNRWDEDRLSGA